MKTLGLIEPQLLVVAAFSRHETVLDEAARRMEAAFGPLLAAGERWPFCQTRYYEKTMGDGLIKQLLAFTRLVDMDQLAVVKRTTIALEAELKNSGYAEARPVNLDPGFLGLGKFVLATTKDQAHRIYLRDGIFAEVTLQFQDGHFRANPWTYPDWAQPLVLTFLDRMREEYWRLRQPRGGRGVVPELANNMRG